MAKFLKGDIFQHIHKMTLSASIGITSIFVVSFVDMYFLSLLGQSELIAAVWYAGILVFILTSIGIAITIVMSSSISKLIGANRKEYAITHAMNIYYFAFIVSLPICILGYIYTPEILSLIWASGSTLEYAINYFRIILFVYPLTLIGMASVGLLRWIGDAKKSMMPTLIAGWVNIILDPIFIFWFDWWIEGAAWATAISRLALFWVAFYWVYQHWYIKFHSIDKLKTELNQISALFFPIFLTNMTTPIGMAFVMKEFSQYGDEAVAGISVISRLSPLIFVYVYAMSAVIGSIVGQNYGAGLLERAKEAIKKSIIISSIYVIIVTISLIVLNKIIISAFQLTGDWAMLLEFYSYFIAILFISNAIVFIACATFNVIGKAKYSMFINICKSILLLVPLIMLFSNIYWVKGILIGEAIAWIISSIIALYYIRKFLFISK